MSARSTRDSAPNLRARAVDVPQPSVLTAVTSAQELRTEVERLKSVYLLDPTPEQAKIVTKAEMDFTDAVIRMCQAAVDAAPDSEVAAKRRELRKAQADKALLAAKLVANRCEGAALAAEEQKCDTPDSHNVIVAASNVHTALSEAKIEVLSAELDVLRAEYLIRHLDSSDVDANASDDVINKYREFVKAKAQLDVEKHKTTADLEAEKRETAAKRKVDERKADLDTAQAVYRILSSHSAKAAELAIMNVRDAREYLNAEERKVSVELVAEKKQAAAKLAVEERKADLAVARAMHLFTHPGSWEADANASLDVIDKYRELVKAKAQLDVEKHKAAADLEAEKREAAAKRKVDERMTDLDKAQAVYRILSSHSAEAVEEATITVRHARAKLEAEERKVAAELAVERSKAAAALVVEERKADLAVARAMYLFTHPGSSEADANASVDVMNKYRELVKAKDQLDVEKHKTTADHEAEKKQTATKLAVEERTHPGSSEAEVDEYDAAVNYSELLKAAESSRNGLSSFLLDGLPPKITMIRRGGPMFKNTTTAKSAGVPAGEGPFKCNANQIFEALLTVGPLTHMSSQAWNQAKKPCTSEAAITSLVDTVMWDAIQACSAPCSVGIEAQIKSSIPDLTLLSADFQRALAVIEVKKPEGALDDATRRRIHRYLSLLRNVEGVMYPIGIITSYNLWQFCWPKYASCVAKATTIDEVRNLPEYQPQGDDLELCVSKVYSCQDRDLKEILMSFVLKAAAIPHGAPRATWALMTPTSSESVFKRPNFKEENRYKMVPTTFERFILLEHLGTGADGSAYLATTEEGCACCVLKFFRPKRKEELESPASAEFKAWKNAYGDAFGVRMVTLCGEDTLLMPFFDVLTSDDWEEPTTVAMVRRHIEDLLENGVCHHDLERRHVAWANRSHDAVLLIDWGKATNNPFAEGAAQKKARKKKKASSEQKSKFLKYALDCLGIDERLTVPIPE